MSARAHPAGPIETELRFLVPDGVKAAPNLDRVELAGMKLAKRGAWQLHCNVYFDTPHLRLRAAGANLRIRTGPGGQRWVTLKQKTKGGHKGALNIRLETEVQLAPGEAAENSKPWMIARGLTTLEIQPMLQVTTLREEHVFDDSHGNQVVMALDVVTYPDGSVERRLEVEMRAGTPQLLRLVEADLRRRIRGLKCAPRGKRSEAIRRLPQLFE